MGQMQETVKDDFSISVVSGKYKEFWKYFQISYRTVTEWELDNRHAPEYVLRLFEYYIQHEIIKKENMEDESI